MIWQAAPALAAYLVVACLVWMAGGWLVGLSAAGQRVMIAIAALWLPALVLLAAIGLFAGLESRINRLVDRAWPGIDA